jgi:hypothetical protein
VDRDQRRSKEIVKLGKKIKPFTGKNHFTHYSTENLFVKIFGHTEPNRRNINSPIVREYHDS